MEHLLKKSPKPPRILIYGPQGLGKSTFGALSDTPVFIQTEDGLDDIIHNEKYNVEAFPLAKTFSDVMTNLTKLAEEEHQFKTVVIDSLDWLEPMIWKQVAAENNVPSIETIGYGKGYALALDLWREYISIINFLRDERLMMVIQTAHSEIKRFENPTTDAYDRYQIKLHRLAAGLVLEHSDIVLFANYFIGTTKKKDGFDERVRAVGSGERMLYTAERPAFVAKTRYNLPAEIPFDSNGQYWATIAQAIPYYNN